MTAAEHHSKLIENTEAWYADLIDWETFRANQRTLWRAIEGSGCKDEVLAIHRERNERMG